MTKLARSLFHRLVAETRGAEIAEAAAVLPLMFMVLLGIFWFGQAFAIYGAITRAAQEGARAGSIPYCATCTSPNNPAQNAAAAVNTALIASKLDPTKSRKPSPAPNLLSCTTGTAQACSSGSTSSCIQFPVQLTSTGLGATGLCGVSVSLQYPFRFWLPFTSINNQTIWLSAEARVRMENR
jgi:Flp pilus assembly protein TadG